MSSYRTTLIALIIGLLLSVTVGCSKPEEPAAVEPSASGLKACPNPLVIQTDWFPEPEHGAIYEMFKGEGSMDAKNGAFKGPLAAEPSITLEIRSGGPLIGLQKTIVVMAASTDIFLGYLDMDDAIEAYDKFPSTAVFAPLDISPLMLMYDPQTYDISSWEEVKGTGAIFNHFAGDSYPEWLVASGILDREQLDPSYDGSPARFISAEGQIMQQGFVSQEPFNYEKVFQRWSKPVKTLLLHDAGFPNYAGALTVLNSRLDAQTEECLSALVPLMQQSAVDFHNDPAVTNELILEAVLDLDRSWVLSEEGVANSVRVMDELGLVGNGHNSTIGDFDLERIEKMIDIISELAEDSEAVAALDPTDLVTNRFIDESIGLD